MKAQVFVWYGEKLFIGEEEEITEEEYKKLKFFLADLSKASNLVLKMDDGEVFFPHDVINKSIVKVKISHVDNDNQVPPSEESPSQV